MRKAILIVGGLLAVIAALSYTKEITTAVGGLLAQIWMEVLMFGGLLAVIAALSIAIILLLSNLGAYFMKIPQGTTAFISAGDSLKAILPNVGGYRMSNAYDLDGRRWLIPEENEKRVEESFFRYSLRGTVWFQKWLWKEFGVKFISLFWPHTHVHEFDIRKGGRRRIEARNEVGADAPLRSRIVDSPGSTIVNSLLFLAPRPVYVEGVELAGDNSRINLLLLPVYRQVIPALPAYYLKGDFFTLLDAAIEAAIVDFFARHRVAVKEGKFAADSYSGQDGCEESPLTYSHWLKLTKAGEGSPLEQRLRHLNVSREYAAKLERVGATTGELAAYINELTPGGPDEAFAGEVARMIPSGIVPRFGFALVSFRIVEWEVHKTTEDLAKALLAKETELHAAEGVRQRAFGERDAAKAAAEGDASRYRLPVEVLTGLKVDPNVAAGVVATQLRTENIRDSKLTTYVEGGASATVMVPASSSKPV